MFVLRDFNELSSNKEAIKTSILDVINTIWNEIYKHDDYLENTVLSDYFDFEFVHLPHMLFE